MFEKQKAIKALQQLDGALGELQQQVAQAEAVSDPLNRLVAFFNVVSPRHDVEASAQAPLRAAIEAVEKANKRGRFDAELAGLRKLRSTLMSAGRSPYGINRTKPGETVTADNVFLGNINGLWTFTATYWKDKFNDASRQFAAEDKKVIEGQANGFFHHNAAAIKAALAALRK